MIMLKQSNQFLKWRAKLKDDRIKAAIAARIFRLANGMPGDVKPVGDGISELRIHYSSGYRVYFKQKGDGLIFLLYGGDKGTQKKDIKVAKKIAKDME